ncbi:Imm26 family immunity protein [Chryseobacterium rhizosphaerae]|uniref:Imm26 family immunity protein n=1 Tax=Chryseobacterium rhizosphaerae TaxID=395937 RepID=UPI0023599E2B|nr:Imm26 family immunity protein [Chryseobacterium rhizosphaerae]MDC8098669.1 immunity 26/phosphotriesterase HocA family protein [Chryseobacterium rhizosphaerae]
MAKRVITKIGDIFSVPINEKEKKYMQLIAFDLAQLNSDTIRAFKRIYSIDENPSKEEIINDKIDFYAHCVTKFGIKLNLWEQIGNSLNIGNIKDPIFKSTDDYGYKENEQPVKVSYNWYVWRINDKNRTKVGRLEGENRNAEIGLIVNPYDILDRIKTGQYNFFYPDFE